MTDSSLQRSSQVSGRARAYEDQVHNQSCLRSSIWVTFMDRMVMGMDSMVYVSH